METKQAPAVTIRQVQRFRELPRVHGRGADVAHLARPHHIVQCVQSFFNRRFIIPAMNLVQVHVIGLQAPQALVKFEEDRFAREAVAVGLVPHHAVEFRGDNHGFAPRVRFQESPRTLSLSPAEYTLAVSKKLIPRSRAWRKNGWLSDSFSVHAWLPRFRLAGGGFSITHAAKTDTRNFQTRLTEIHIFHGKGFSST